MSFPHYKKSILQRTDNSNKGSIDKPIIPLVNKTNSQQHYCTTSSCSGRTVLFEAKSHKKNEFKTLFASHSKVSFTKLKKALQTIDKSTIWFRFEPIIIHIACDSLDSATTLLNLARQHFKHSGILSINSRTNRYVLEIRGSEFIEAPVAVSGKIVVSDDVLRLLCTTANEKLTETHRRMNAFKDAL